MLCLETYNVAVAPGRRLNTPGCSYPSIPFRIPMVSTYTLTIYASRQAWGIGYWMCGRFIEVQPMKNRASLWTRACYLAGHMQEL